MPQPRRRLLPEHYDRVRELAARGFSERSIAKFLGMSYGAWRRALDADARAKGALDEGRAEEHDALVGALYREAVEKGKIVAAIFLLKCRHGYRETAEVATNQVQVVFQMPAPLTPEQYEKLITSTPTRALKEAGDDR